MGNELILSTDQKKMFTASDCFYLCLIRYEDGQTALEAVNCLEKVNYLQNTARSGLSAMLSVDIFAKLP